MSKKPQEPNDPNEYSTYVPLLLREMWEQSRLTVEQAIGHMLQRLLNHDERIRRLEQMAGLPRQET